MQEKANNKLKEKKVYFSEEIDSRIHGFALVFTFIIIGLILQFYPNYFGMSLVTTIIKWLFIGVGMLGMTAETIKFKNKIIGLDTLVLGLFFLGIWFALFILVHHWIANILSFTLLSSGLYAVFLGFQQMLYSFAKHKHERKNGETNGNNKGDILLFLTKLFGAILVIVQTCKAILELK